MYENAIYDDLNLLKTFSFIFFEYEIKYFWWLKFIAYKKYLQQHSISIRFFFNFNLQLQKSKDLKL